MGKKEIKLVDLGGSPDYKNLKVFVNSIEVRFMEPVIIDFKAENELRVEINGESDTCEFSNFPIKKTINTTTGEEYSIKIISV